MKTSRSKDAKIESKAAAEETPAVARPPKRNAKTTPATTDATTMPTGASASQTPAPQREITTELIAKRAYIIWEQQGRPQGREMANWLLAESQLKQEIQSFTA